MICSVFVLTNPITTFSQTGGTYVIEKSVIASGGNTSSGGNFSLQGTGGQSVSNASPQGGTFQILSGFWTPVFAPTAASVSISGRVSFVKGSGIPRALVQFVDSSGTVRLALTNNFGYFRFDDVEVGQTYVFEVFAKGSIFAPQVLNVQGEITGLDFFSLNQFPVRNEQENMN